VRRSGFPSSVLVIGSGAAGLSAAEALRRAGYQEPITILGEEIGEPYDRPPLSKQVLRGSWDLERARLLSERRHEEIRARWLLGRRAVALDVERKIVTTDDGSELGYGAAVVATGLRPRTLPARDLTGVYVLRTSADALSLRSVLGAGTRLVVVGAGFLGLEVAATARTLGADVTIVEPLEQPLANRLGGLAASRLLDVHRGRGVRVLTGVGVESLHGGRPVPAPPFQGSSGEPGGPLRLAVKSVELTDGTRLDADVVLVAIGCAPSLDWLAGSGVELDDGVVCDEYCRAAPGVWAAGDVAPWNHVALGRHVRLEHRMNATEQGQAVAKNILGSSAPFTPIPFFWTDQYEVRIQVWGIVPEDATADVTEGDAGGDSFVVTFREPAGRRLVGALGWNAAARLRAYRQEIEATW
jgi:NADPH-dependent 2,4-dienoyl-CoA reductase/sulfur reductase-like enzyme